MVKAEVRRLLPLVGVPPASLSLPSKGGFWQGLQQAEDWAIKLSGSRWNHSLEWSQIDIGPSPKLPGHIARSSRLYRFLSILLYFYGRSTSLLGLFPLEDHAIICERSNRWSWCWRPKSQALLCPVGHPSRHCFVQWLTLRLSLIELKVLLIALLPKLIVAFICRASRFLSPLPPLARKTLIYR